MGRERDRRERDVREDGRERTRGRQEERREKRSHVFSFLSIGVKKKVSLLDVSSTPLWERSLHTRTACLLMFGCCY